MAKNLVVDMYSATLRYYATNYVALDYPTFGQELHIEHSVPKMWWGSHEWTSYKDLYEIVHFLVRHHTESFQCFRDTFLPNLKQIRTVLNKLQVSHADWVN